MLISCQGLHKSYGVHALFSGLSVGFAEGERVGLIGPNGSGKSTLLKILAGLEEPDEGTVSRNRMVETAYLAQEDDLAPESSAEECLAQSLPAHLPEGEQQQRVRDVLRELEFADPSAQVKQLSGGWKKRLAIGRVLVQRPNLLLLDEPTNHLDLEGVLWLENLLQQAEFSFVLVSHDRTFLQNTTRQTLEINKSYPSGFLKIAEPYDQFLEKKEAFLLNQQQQEVTLANKVRREEEWLRRGPKARTSKARYRIENAAALQQKLQLLRNLNSQAQATAIDFDATDRKTKKLIDVRDISFGYSDNPPIFQNLSLQLSKGTCVGVLGRNGAGKSTLLKLLKHELRPTTGEVVTADALKVVHFDQHREQLPLNITLKQALSPAGETVIFQGRSMHIASWAQRFLFPKNKLTLPLSQLSGGERARVLIANLMLQPADVLLLDEPTNDLDIATLEVLEESLAEFPGAVLLITHDRYLMDRLSDWLLCLNGDGTVGFFADYAQWRQAHQQKTKRTDETPPKADKAETKPASKKLSYEERKEWQRIEGRIEKAEAEVEKIQAQLHDPALVNDHQKLRELTPKLETAEAKVAELYARWEVLEAKAAE
jgi:ATP-binding cassette subfamily F protein uup